jgi:branched-chain amino acid transport system ATP-binding protein
MTETLLRIEGLNAGYGDVQVLWGINLQVQARQITCIIGSNGAGKSTLLRTISGLVRTKAGSISFAGRPIGNASPDSILAAGIAHVPEGRRLFRGLSVRDNLLLGAYLRAEGRSEIEQDLEAVYAIFPRLKERQRQDATTLSGGEQQMCAIGRGIMSRPKLLMVDELSLGLAPRMVETMTEALLEINRRGTTILVVEQDVYTAFELAHRGYVIETGRVMMQGSAQELSEDARVRQAYLGI